MRIVSALIVASSLGLAACTSAIPRTESFSRASSQGLLSFELTSEVAGTVIVTVARYDPASKRVTANSFSGQYLVNHPGPASKHHFMRVPPGTYVLKSVAVQVLGMAVTCLSEGTIAFNAVPGRISYLGSFRVDGKGVHKSGNDIEAAKVALRSYPEIDGNIEQAAVIDATFLNSTSLGRKICGG